MSFYSDMLTVNMLSQKVEYFNNGICLKIAVGLLAAGAVFAQMPGVHQAPGSRLFMFMFIPHTNHSRVCVKLVYNTYLGEVC